MDFFFLGKITKKIPLGNSGGNKIIFSVVYEESDIEMSRIIDKPLWTSLTRGNNILIKAIVSDSLTWSIVLDEKQFLVPCLNKYKQPPTGWKNLPIKECDE